MREVALDAPLAHQFSENLEIDELGEVGRGDVSIPTGRQWSSRPSPQAAFAGSRSDHLRATARNNLAACG